MSRNLTLASLAALIGLSFPLSEPFAQSAKDLVGAWTPISVENTLPDGKKVQSFGANPQGLLIFDGEGRYSLQLCSAGRPKFASNNRMAGTPEENQAAVHGCNPHWGRYTVNEADRSLTFKIEHALFTNWEGTEQKRTFTIKGDELVYNVPSASAGGTSVVAWRRAK